LDKNRLSEILEAIPQKPPFRFIDEIVEVNENHIRGNYTFKEDEFFYTGHFPDFPITPGVILTECMAQIGLVAFGIFLENISPENMKNVNIFFVKSDVQFHQMVKPGEKVTVSAEKEFFRLRRLQCKVIMYNQAGEKICSGTIAGMFAKNK
jgi:3-hydroxyacyl-[acyl-carrier-protein] dehydratase